MTKLSHSRSGNGSTAPWSLRRTVRRSSDSSVAYVFGTSIAHGSSPGARCQNLPRYGPDATYVTTSTSSPASSNARSSARSYRVETISWCGAPRSRSSGAQRREEPMHGLWLERLLEAPVQLVVQRARAVHRRDVLRDAGEVERAVAGVAERGGEVRGEVGAAVEPEHRDDTARDERLDDLGVGVVRRRRSARASARPRGGGSTPGGAGPPRPARGRARRAPRGARRRRRAPPPGGPPRTARA